MRNIEPSNNDFIFTSRSTGTANSTQGGNYEKRQFITFCTAYATTCIRADDSVDCGPIFIQIGAVNSESQSIPAL